jgi:hypothetical protein
VLSSLGKQADGGSSEVVGTWPIAKQTVVSWGLSVAVSSSITLAARSIGRTHSYPLRQSLAFSQVRMQKVRPKRP